MADKKVERTGRERPLTPTQKMEAALSDPGTMNMAETTHDRGKSALVDKFREREERWRRDQSLHDLQAAHAVEKGTPSPEVDVAAAGAEADGAAGSGGQEDEGGDS